MTNQYKGFDIQKDNICGYSLYSGRIWLSSDRSVTRLKRIVDNIIQTKKETDKYILKLK